MHRILLSVTLSFAALTALSAPATADHEHGVRNGGGEIILYSGRNFTGEARVYYGDVDTLARDGFNDIARSVEIRGGAWTLCKDRGGRGRCRTIEYSVADLGRLGLDCELTSFYQAGISGRGYTQRGSGGYGRQAYPVVLFSKDDFEGRSIGISGAVNLRDIGFDNRADSILINEGKWIVCKKRDLRGDCEVISRSFYDLDDIDLDGNISSIAPYEGGRRYSRRNW